ncbi:kinesin-like protein KIN-14U [Ricinus communis]|uniref:kinesin-like protein KIN-14U n=1 Tax=Ricinus communis TaxID=3988 RepID=UPI00201A9166|nr:kinesin-like protein KIN-14U [Ricinus communis]XP_048236277.1 kinesin-like protein KIN-14U [Ricinus communis]
MFISTENEVQISFSLDNVNESLKSFPMRSNLDCVDRMVMESELLNLQPPPTIYTDVNIVPEQEKNSLMQSISNLEGEIAQLKQKERSLTKKRKEALNKILDIKGCIRVFCRIRPFLLTEWRRIHEPVLIESEKVVIKYLGSMKAFRFDKVFNQAATQGWYLISHFLWGSFTSWCSVSF